MTRNQMRLALFGLAALVCLLFDPLLASAACKGSDPGLPLSHYDGTIGTYRIRMSLELDGGAVRGTYFYLSDLKDIDIRGTIVDASKLVLEQLDGMNKVVARFEGKFATSDPQNHVGGPLECEVIVGAWRRVDSAEQLPVYLLESDEVSGDLQHQYAGAGIQDDELVNRNAQLFQGAVKRDDRKTVASLITYPINVGVGPPHCIRVRNRAELLKNYDQIFSLAVRDAIARSVPRAMFSRDNGVLLDDGLVYFGATGKVVQLNACNWPVRLRDVPPTN